MYGVAESLLPLSRLQLAVGWICGWVGSVLYLLPQLDGLIQEPACMRAHKNLCFNPPRISKPHEPSKIKANALKYIHVSNPLGGQPAQLVIHVN